jgi:hypothetical protein
MNRIQLDNNKKYQMKVDQDKLVFITSSFKAEKTSVLHPGVYTKEFASMLFASAACIFAYISTDLASIKSAIMRYIILIVIFVVAFLGANKYIFKERYLEADFNKSDKTVNIVRSGLITKKSEKIPFAKIKSVDLGIKKFVPENIDGIDFVQAGKYRWYRFRSEDFSSAWKCYPWTKRYRGIYYSLVTFD